MKLKSKVKRVYKATTGRLPKSLSLLTDDDLVSSGSVDFTPESFGASTGGMSMSDVNDTASPELPLS